MEQMEEALGSILNNPQIMQTILSMAQSMGQTSPPQPREDSHNSAPLPALDPGILQSLSSFAGSGNIDTDQRALLNALTPYLSSDRVSKLEKAMRAAKMARMASVFLNSGGLQLLTGR